MDVIEESIEGVGAFGAMGTVESAPAGLNHHDVLVERFAVFAAEPDCYRSGLLWAAAAAIHAGTTVLGLVLLEAPTTCIGELHRLTGSSGPAALLSLLLQKIKPRTFYQGLFLWLMLLQFS